MGETKKRKSVGSGNAEGKSTLAKKQTRCNAMPVVDFLKLKTKADQELHQQELDVKKKEFEHNQGMIQQQQQMNQAVLAIVQQLLHK